MTSLPPSPDDDPPRNDSILTSSRSSSRSCPLLLLLLRIDKTLSGSLIAVGDAVLLSHPNSERRPTPFGRRNLTLSVSRGPAAGQLAFEPLLQVHAGLYPIVTF